MDMQALINALNKTARDTRSQYQMTLGGMIAALDKMPADMPIEYENGGHPTDPHSYRGYYSDLSFETGEGASTVAKISAVLKSALGETFMGYKGGDFPMDEDTPLWSSTYGTSSGKALMDIDVVNNRAIIRIKQVD